MKTFAVVIKNRLSDFDYHIDIYHTRDDMTDVKLYDIAVKRVSSPFEITTITEQVKIFIDK